MNKHGIYLMLLGRWIAISNGEQPGPVDGVERLVYGNYFSYYRGKDGRQIGHKKLRMLVNSLDKFAEGVYDASTNSGKED